MAKITIPLIVLATIFGIDTWYNI